MASMVPGANKQAKQAREAQIAADVAEAKADADAQNDSRIQRDLMGRRRRQGGTILGGAAPTNLLGVGASLGQ